MYDIITIGSSLVDSFISSKAFELQKTQEGTLLCQAYGEKIDVDRYIIRTGGGGGNTAVGFSRMGFRTAVITELGKDILSEFIMDDFHKEYVATNLVVREKHEETGGSIILLSKDGGRTIMVHRGASSMLDPKDIPLNYLKSAKWIHLSSIAGQLDTLQHIFSNLKNEEPHLSWNPGNKELKHLLDGELNIKDIPCKILFVNQEEWDLIEKIHSEVLENIKYIVVTRGKKGGVVYVDGELEVEYQSEDVDSKDDTGAGDSFGVGFVTAFLKNKSPEECCEWGKKNAVSVIQQIGAKPGLLTIDQM
jgi:2-dehydro-3-deoxygluconokinase